MERIIRIAGWPQDNSRFTEPLHRGSRIKKYVFVVKLLINYINVAHVKYNYIFVGSDSLGKILRASARFLEVQRAPYPLEKKHRALHADFSLWHSHPMMYVVYTSCAEPAQRPSEEEQSSRVYKYLQ